MAEGVQQTGYVTIHPIGQNRIIFELAQTYTPKTAIREFVTNSLDERIPGKKGNITVTLDPADRSITILDDGKGMDYAKVASLSSNIGNSEKYGKVNMRGEKGIGLLSFGSLGKGMRIISRPHTHSSDAYGYTRWEMKGPDKGIACEPPRKLEPAAVKNDFGINFPHGTMVIIDRVDPSIFKDNLPLPILKEWLRRLYNPALRKKLVDIKVGKFEKFGKIDRNREIKYETLDSIVYENSSSSKLIEKSISVPIKNEEKPGELEVLLFLDPESTSGKVRVYTKDVLVYEALTEMDEFKNEFKKSPVWGSLKLYGEINDEFNRLTLGRDGLDRRTNSAKAWFSEVEKIGEEIRPEVEKIKAHVKNSKEQAYCTKVYNVGLDVWNELGIGTSRYGRDSNGEPTPIEGETPSPGGQPPVPPKPREIPQTEREVTKTGIRPAGPGTFIRKEGGIIQKVSPKKSNPFGTTQPVEFPLSEQSLRSKLEEPIGVPTVYINSAHSDYKIRAEGTKDNNPIRYITELQAKEWALHEVQREQKESKQVSDIGELTRKALKIEEDVRLTILNRIGIK